MAKRLLILCLVGISFHFRVQAQLAITEIQTQESGSNTLGKKGPDWWELSNYGTSDIDLTGYCWNDGGHAVQGADLPFTGVTIHAGETIVITESNTVVKSGGAFLQWWGTNSVGANTQIIVSPNPNGLSASGEAVRLWLPGANTNPSGDPNDPADLVDRVDVGASGTAPNGGVPTFIYDPSNGTFDLFSTNGVGGAFIAATSPDVGSPGNHPVAGPIVITRQPGPPNLTVPINTPVSYTVAGFGLPKPQYQWLFNGSPADTNALGATISFAITNNQSMSTLTIAAAQSVDAGTFSVVASNGVQMVTCSNAVLTVTATPSAPTISSFSPTNLTAYIGQMVTFTVSAYGSPSPAFQWETNNVAVGGQSGSQFQVYLSDTNQSGTYSVLVTNTAGRTNATGFLVVTPKPDLRITEVMSSESTNNDTGDTSSHSDWWELSNFGDFPVNLQGYRFDDNHFLLADADTITNNVTIQPGESIILAEDMTPDQFQAWWGPQNLPANLQIITYPRIGFSAAGDSVTLWNAAATTEADYIDSESFSTATRGVSFGFDPNINEADYGFLGYAPDGLSTAGTDGAFVAATGGDVGSPGTILNLPRFNSITMTSDGCMLSWFSQPDWTNTVQFKTSLSDSNWTTLTNLTSGAADVMNFVDPTTGTQRFYRVELNLSN